MAVSITLIQQDVQLSRSYSASHSPTFPLSKQALLDLPAYRDSDEDVVLPSPPAPTDTDPLLSEMMLRYRQVHPIRPLQIVDKSYGWHS